MDAAAQILEAQGPQHATTNHIAERAGVSIGTLYQYFPNKQALFTELARRFVFMTGGAFTDRARQFLAEHTIDRLEKPFALEDVERLVAAAVKA